MNKEIEVLSEIIGSCNTKCDHPYSCYHCKATRALEAGYRKVEDIVNKIMELAQSQAREIGNLKPFITIEELSTILCSIKEEIK